MIKFLFGNMMYLQDPAGLFPGGIPESFFGIDHQDPPGRQVLLLQALQKDRKVLSRLVCRYHNINLQILTSFTEQALSI